MQHKRYEAIKTKAQINSKREALIVGKLARANNKIRQLKIVTTLENNLVGKVCYVTILATQSSVANLKQMV